MEESKNIEILSEIPPIFNRLNIDNIAEKPNNLSKNIFFYQVLTGTVIIILLIVFKVFFPDIYAVLHVWFSEKLNLPPLSL